MEKTKLNDNTSFKRGIVKQVYTYRVKGNTVNIKLLYFSLMVNLLSLKRYYLEIL